MTQSDVFASVKEGETGVSYLSYDISNLAEGTYCFEPDVFVHNEFGTGVSYDHPRQKIVFQVTRSANLVGITWQKKYWGNVMLNTMHVENPNEK